MKTVVLQLGFELIANNGNQEYHCLKTHYFISVVFGQGGLSSELMTPKFFRKFHYVCRYFTLSVFLLVSGTHCNHSPALIKI
jgi:hypothetical protein